MYRRFSCGLPPSLRDRGRRCRHGRQRSHPGQSQGGRCPGCGHGHDGGRRDLLPHHANQSRGDPLSAPGCRAQSPARRRHPANWRAHQKRRDSVQPDTGIPELAHMSASTAQGPAEAAGCLPASAAPRVGRANFIQRTPIRAVLISVLVLAPCFWQPHIQAVDLSSHLYNAWLSILIGEGKAPGLAIVSQHTNVLFDLVLAGLMRALGPWGAEHIAVPLAVLVFFWGAFVMICCISHRRPWYILSLIAMLSYGWTYHMGFMNFYLSLGLCFWAFGLLWQQHWKAALYALPLVALAFAAHALPIAWLAGSMAYTWLARKIP